MPQAITKITREMERFATKANLAYHIGARYYHGIIQREVQLANITASDRVLFIGGGVCPFSAILIHQKTGAAVTVIDKDLCCAKEAQDFVEARELSCAISLLHSDADDENLNFLDYSVICFALQVTPLECVFSHIKSQVPTGTRLLVRRPRKKLKRAFCDFSNSVLGRSRQIAHSTFSNVGTTYLYVKGESCSI
jgi:hypothetical protein